MLLERIARRFGYEIDIYPILRPMFQFIKDSGCKDLVGCEIGVYLGENAKVILRNLPIRKLYLIDPYEPYYEYGELIEDSNDETFEKARKRLKRFKGKIEFIRKKSVDAANSVPNNLDFVYLDGNHEYEHLKRDIECYLPKVKKGGVLGGHDINFFTGVFKAVSELAVLKGFEVNVEREDWWVVV